MKKQKDHTKLYMHFLEIAKDFMKNDIDDVKEKITNKKSSATKLVKKYKEEMVAMIIVNRMNEHFKEKGLSVWDLCVSDFKDEINMVMESIINK